VPQKIENFASVEQPFTVVLLIDVSPSTQYKITEIQDAAIAFVNQLRQNDRVVVISFDQRVHVLSPVTNNRALLRNAILQVDFGDGTSLYEAVADSLNRQLRQIEGRKAVVLFTDGVDTTSRRASYESTIRDAEESEALIYPIRYDTFSDMGGGGTYGGGYPNQYPRRRRGGGRRLGDVLGDILSGGGGVYGGGYPQGGGSAGGSREDYARGAQYLQQLAQNSGGRIFQANTTANLDAAFSGIAEELRRQYTIGYYPENAGQAGQRKQIKVRVSRPNAVVRAKNSYIVGGVGAQNNLPPTRKQQPPRILNRLPY
jgi:Ca-activated chloride channel family protein